MTEACYIAKHSHKGFSLIEVVIILGIVSLVIGGIWMVASDINKRLITQQEAKGILVIVNNVRKSFKGVYDGTSQLSLADTIESSGMLAGADGFSASPIAARFSAPDGSLIYVNMGPTALGDDIDIKIGTSIRNTGDCIRLVSLISGVAANQLHFIGFSNATYYTFPISPTASNCNVGGQLDFAFKL